MKTCTRLAFAAVFFALSGAAPAFAQGDLPSASYLVIEVPNAVIDDVVGVQHGTAAPGWPIPPELDLSFKLCGTYQCICSDFFAFPDECSPDGDQGRINTLSLISTARTPLVHDVVVRELKSGKYSAVKLCNTAQSAHVRCVTARLPRT